ncbi:MAG: CrcB family protein, partial [Lysinibacillus sp.]
VAFMALMIGSVCGALLRLAMYEMLKAKSAPAMPTLLVNITGSLLLGLYVQYGNGQFHSFFVVGLLSSFTTFSTFSVDSLKLLLDRKWLQAFYYICGNLVLCFAAIMLGLFI